MFFSHALMILLLIRPWLGAVLQTQFEGWEVGLGFPVGSLGHVGMMSKGSYLSITWPSMEWTSQNSGRRKDTRHRFACPITTKFDIRDPLLQCNLCSRDFSCQIIPMAYIILDYWINSTVRISAAEATLRHKIWIQNLMTYKKKGFLTT